MAGYAVYQWWWRYFLHLHLDAVGPKWVFHYSRPMYVEGIPMIPGC
jgi:hypothetical protein